MLPWQKFALWAMFGLAAAQLREFFGVRSKVLPRRYSKANPVGRRLHTFHVTC